jgi:hypothetical protein
MCTSLRVSHGKQTRPTRLGAACEFESPTPPKIGGQKTERVSRTISAKPPEQLLPTRSGGLSGAQSPAPSGAFCVRPAWAYTCGCKSRCELVTVSKAKRNCVRATKRGKKAWSINLEPMNKNRVEGAAKQGERASNRKALVTEARWLHLHTAHLMQSAPQRSRCRSLWVERARRHAMQRSSHA